MDGRTADGEPGSGGPADRADTKLELRYRRLLMVLPRSCREARGEKLVGALMDGAPEGSRWPKPGEVFSLAMHGVRVRTRAGGAAVDQGAATSLARAVGLCGAFFLAFQGFLSGIEMAR